MNQRFEHMDKRFSFMQWSIFISTALISGLIALLKFVPSVAKPITDDIRLY